MIIYLLSEQTNQRFYLPHLPVRPSFLPIFFISPELPSDPPNKHAYLPTMPMPYLGIRLPRLIPYLSNETTHGNPL